MDDVKDSGMLYPFSFSIGIWISICSNSEQTEMDIVPPIPLVVATDTVETGNVDADDGDIGLIPLPIDENTDEVTDPVPVPPALPSPGEEQCQLEKSQEYRRNRAHSDHPSLCC